MAIIAFDLDGTLVDSVPDLHIAVNALLISLDKPETSLDAVRGWVGNGMEVLVARALANDVNASPDDSEYFASALRKFKLEYARTEHKASCVYPGVEAALSQLTQLGYKLAVVTNKAEAYARALLDTLDLSPYFELLLGGDSVENKKPAPDGLHQVKQHFGVNATEILMVGDSENDIIAAHQFGCPVIAVSYGYNYGRDIALTKPDRIVDTFSAVVHAVDDLKG